ncbi:hypothetical protein FB451DRAFT_1377412 [Mycena latifolia]|nr:hypothetical protein FB451DRAFT_1377412 [Mycena latifolia]
MIIAVYSAPLRSGPVLDQSQTSRHHSAEDPHCSVHKIPMMASSPWTHCASNEDSGEKKRRKIACMKMLVCCTARRLFISWLPTEPQSKVFYTLRGLGRARLKRRFVPTVFANPPYSPRQAGMIVVLIHFEPRIATGDSTGLVYGLSTELRPIDQVFAVFLGWHARGRFHASRAPNIGHRAENGLVPSAYDCRAAEGFFARARIEEIDSKVGFRVALSLRRCLSFKGILIIQ